MSLKNIILIKHKYGRLIIYPILVLGISFSLQKSTLFASPSNGFDLNNTLVPSDKIYHGGPARDGIPAIDYPVFITAIQAGYIQRNDRVLGLFQNGIAKAYPINILNYHEIVNDQIGLNPIVITYCPLCGSGIAFSSKLKGKAQRFGVSGLLYNSDMLLYDRETESLWSQILGQAISGPLRGQKLERISLSNTTWADWRQQHPDTLILSTNTGHWRDYSRNPYPGYEKSDQLYFPVNYHQRQYHPKELIIGIEVDGKHKAYPFTELSRSPANLLDTLAGQKLKIVFSRQHRSGKILDQNNQEIPSMTTYWFAWLAFHPDTDIYKYNSNLGTSD